MDTSVPELYIRAFSPLPCPVFTQCPVYILSLSLRSLSCCTVEPCPLGFLRTDARDSFLPFTSDIVSGGGPRLGIVGHCNLGVLCVRFLAGLDVSFRVCV